MKLYGYGDSWTEGVGVNRVIEDTFIKSEDRKSYRNQHAWTKHLSEKLSIDSENNGIAGCSNKKIFDTIISDIKCNKIKENDLVVILWSSSLRDDVSFFPENEWHCWGNAYLDESEINNSYLQFRLTNKPIYNQFIFDYKMFYIAELMNQNYYNIVNQNYIIFLQKLFEHYNIKYIMADAFDHMIIDVNESDNKTNYINKDNYWNFSSKTFNEYLSSLNNTLVWEDTISFKNAPIKHPSILGHIEIAKELYRFILDSNILNQKYKKNQYKIF